MGGNHVSHSKRWIRLNVSADGLRLINKRGLNACLKDATAAGLIKTI